MENRLRNHINVVFSNMPQTQNTLEVKEEILQNLIEKYHDLIAEGKNEETAYSIAVASIGDVSRLFEGAQNASQAELQKQKSRSALLKSIAIMLYILSVVPPMILSATVYDDTIGAVLMFVMCAIATGILVYNSSTKPKHNDATIVNEFKQWQAGEPSKRSKLKSIDSILWSSTVLIYLIVSFATFAWHVTWIIFLVAIPVSQIIRLLFDFEGSSKATINQGAELTENQFNQYQANEYSKKSKLKAVDGILWSITVIIYFAVSFSTSAWHISWIVFLAAVPISQIIRLLINSKN
ncbi:hypothetical protein AGMMS50284_1240 [Clostridia bacterium]|nr:hypothetical protein AGMMS50284_1240 [Clostridia bacterium]